MPPNFSPWLTKSLNSYDYSPNSIECTHSCVYEPVAKDMGEGNAGNSGINMCFLV